MTRRVRRAYSVAFSSSSSPSGPTRLSFTGTMPRAWVDLCRACKVERSHTVMAVDADGRAGRAGPPIEAV